MEFTYPRPKLIKIRLLPALTPKLLVQMHQRKTSDPLKLPRKRGLPAPLPPMTATRFMIFSRYLRSLWESFVWEDRFCVSVKLAP